MDLCDCLYPLAVSSVALCLFTTAGVHLPFFSIVLMSLHSLALLLPFLIYIFWNYFVQFPYQKYFRFVSLFNVNVAVVVVAIKRLKFFLIGCSNAFSHLFIIPLGCEAYCHGKFMSCAIVPQIMSKKFRSKGFKELIT